MIQDSGSDNYIELTADIVSAYVSNNSVQAGDIPSLINQVHSALMRVSTGQSDAPTEPLKPAVPVKKSIHRVSRGRKEIQVAEETSAHPVQHDAGTISR